LAGAGHDYNPIESREQLDQKIRSLQLKVEALQDELTQVDFHVAATGRRLGQRVAIGVGLLVVLFAGIGSHGWIVNRSSLCIGSAGLPRTADLQIYATKPPPKSWIVATRPAASRTSGRTRPRLV
jgi:hypothetical protein